MAQRKTRGVGGACISSHIHRDSTMYGENCYVFYNSIRMYGVWCVYIKGGLTPTAHVRISMNLYPDFYELRSISLYTQFVCILFTILNIFVYTQLYVVMYGVLPSTFATLDSERCTIMYTNIRFYTRRLKSVVHLSKNYNKKKHVKRGAPENSFYRFLTFCVTLQYTYQHYIPTTTL